MCFVWIWEQRAIISLYSINWMVCITETECVYCAVRTGYLYIILRSAHTAVFMCFVWIWEQTAIISLYSINWLVCITETESVYCAVRTGSLYIIDLNFCLQNDKWPEVKHSDNTCSFCIVYKFVVELTFQSLPVTWCTNSLTFNNCTFCPHRIYVFYIYLRTNSALCHLQHKLIGFYNLDEKCCNARYELGL